MTVTNGICFFKFKKYSKTINTIAAPTFGVLCIHANSDTMRQWLWKDILNNVGYYSDLLMPFYAIGCVMGVFAVCVVIDIIGIQFIEKPFFKLLDRYWDTFLNWFEEKRFFSKLYILRWIRNERNNSCRWFRYKTVSFDKSNE